MTASETEIEQRLKLGGAKAPRLSPEHIDGCIKEVKHVRMPDGRTTICEITLTNGFTVRGESSCISAENFRADIGQDVSFRDARDKIWQLEGYLLQQRIYEESRRPLAQEHPQQQQQPQAQAAPRASNYPVW